MTLPGKTLCPFTPKQERDQCSSRPWAGPRDDGALVFATAVAIRVLIDRCSLVW